MLDAYHPTGGAHDTSALVAAAGQLRAIGWEQNRISKAAFPPFILSGFAEWTDSWHAPRYGPAPGQIRKHEGQDVFCEPHAPVLATETGTVDFGTDSLGGKVAHLYRSDGSYWYYAHLSSWNTGRFSSGDTVHRGDVIGFCGNSGDAAGGAMHVHFGWYSGGVAHDPMSHLVSWLRQATEHAHAVVAAAMDQRVKFQDSLSALRRFGDAFAPDATVLRGNLLSNPLASLIDIPIGAHVAASSAPTIEEVFAGADS